MRDLHKIAVVVGLGISAGSSLQAQRVDTRFNNRVQNGMALGDGHALDHNLYVGDRYNYPREVFGPAYRYPIIYGNLGGGRFDYRYVNDGLRFSPDFQPGGRPGGIFTRSAIFDRYGYSGWDVYWHRNPLEDRYHESENAQPFPTINDKIEKASLSAGQIINSYSTLIGYREGRSLAASTAVTTAVNNRVPSTRVDLRVSPYAPTPMQSSSRVYGAPLTPILKDYNNSELRTQLIELRDKTLTKEDKEDREKIDALITRLDKFNDGRPKLDIEEFKKQERERIAKLTPEEREKERQLARKLLESVRKNRGQ